MCNINCSWILYSCSRQGINEHHWSTIGMLLETFLSLEAPMGVSNENIGLQWKYRGLQWKYGGVSNENLGVSNENMGISKENRGSPTRIWGSPLKIYESPTKIWSLHYKSGGLQRKSGGLQRESVSLQRKSGVSNENLLVSCESLGVSSKTFISCGSPIVLQWRWFLPRLLFLLYLLIDLHAILRYNNFDIFHQILKIFNNKILLCFLVCAQNYICFFFMYNIFWYVFLPLTMNPTQSFGFV